MDRSNDRPELTIRPAAAGDAAALAPLLAQLGYPASEDAVAERLGRLAAFASAVALVATEGADVVGLVTAHVFPSIHADLPAAWITTLVVATPARRRGVGGRLVHAAEAWAVARGAVRLSVTSGVHRADAHRFYTGLGYETTGHRFTRVIG